MQIYPLADGDEIAFGERIFRFIFSVEARSRLLAQAPPPSESADLSTSHRRDRTPISRFESFRAEDLPGSPVKSIRSPQARDASQFSPPPSSHEAPPSLEAALSRRAMRRGASAADVAVGSPATPSRGSSLGDGSGNDGGAMVAAGDITNRLSVSDDSRAGMGSPLPTISEADEETLPPRPQRGGGGSRRRLTQGGGGGESSVLVEENPFLGEKRVVDVTPPATAGATPTATAGGVASVTSPGGGANNSPSGADLGLFARDAQGRMGKPKRQPSRLGRPRAEGEGGPETAAAAPADGRSDAEADALKIAAEERSKIERAEAAAAAAAATAAARVAREEEVGRELAALKRIEAERIEAAARERERVKFEFLDPSIFAPSMRDLTAGVISRGGGLEGAEGVVSLEGGGGGNDVVSMQGAGVGGVVRLGAEPSLRFVDEEVVALVNTPADTRAAASILRSASLRFTSRAAQEGVAKKTRPAPPLKKGTSFLLAKSVTKKLLFKSHPPPFRPPRSIRLLPRAAGFRRGGVAAAPALNNPLFVCADIARASLVGVR
jgi:hypothetical protein